MEEVQPCANEIDRFVADSKAVAILINLMIPNENLVLISV